MKLRRTLTEREIEITADEMRRMIDTLPTPMFIGLRKWLKDNFGLDLMPYIPEKKKE